MHRALKHFEAKSKKNVFKVLLFSNCYHSFFMAVSVFLFFVTSSNMLTSVISSMYCWWYRVRTHDFCTCVGSTSLTHSTGLTEKKYFFVHNNNSTVFIFWNLRSFEYCFYSSRLPPCTFFSTSTLSSVSSSLMIIEREILLNDRV